MKPVDYLLNLQVPRSVCRKGKETPQCRLPSIFKGNFTHIFVYQYINLYLTLSYSIVNLRYIK